MKNRSFPNGTSNENSTGVLAKDLYNDMMYAEAQAHGLIPGDATTANSSYVIPDNILADLGVAPEEVGQ